MTNAPLVKASPTTQRELGFGDGARALFRSVSWLATTPSAWPLAIVPSFICCALIGVCTWLGFRAGIALVGPHLGDGVWGSVFRALADVLVFLLSLIVGIVVGLSLAQPLAAPALDALAKKRAQSLGIVDFIDTKPLASMARAIRVTGLALVVGLPVLLLLSLVTLVVPVLAPLTMVLKFVVAAWLATWDVFDYAFGLDGLGVRARLAWLSEHGLAAFAFGLAFAAVALVPGLGLFVLPIGVVGAADLFTQPRRTRKGS